MRARTVLAAALIGLTSLSVPLGWAAANHVRIDVNVDPQHPAPPVVAPAPPATLQAEEIKANQVRAHTIYANKIEADEVRGAIQTRGVRIGDVRGTIRAPDVAASTIYADKITANTVVAEVVYVRDLDRR